MQKGKFIVIEGPDGSGTTTQSTILHNNLLKRGLSANITREPSSGPIGKTIRTLLAGSDIPSDALQILFTADRAWHLKHEIHPALEDGTNVVCEQYVMSTMLFGKAAGLDEAWLQAMNAKFKVPDFQIVLLPPFEVCHRRWSGRDTQEILEEETYQQKVYDAYAAYAHEQKIPVFDTSRDVNEVSTEILDAVTDKLFKTT